MMAARKTNGINYTVQSFCPEAVIRAYNAKQGPEKHISFLCYRRGETCSTTITVDIKWITMDSHNVLTEFGGVNTSTESYLTHPRVQGFVTRTMTTLYLEPSAHPFEPHLG